VSPTADNSARGPFGGGCVDQHSARPGAVAVLPGKEPGQDVSYGLVTLGFRLARMEYCAAVRPAESVAPGE
jgi:hypothetical protein